MVNHYPERTIRNKGWSCHSANFLWCSFLLSAASMISCALSSCEGKFLIQRCNSNNDTLIDRVLSSTLENAEFRRRRCLHFEKFWHIQTLWFALMPETILYTIMLMVTNIITSNLIKITNKSIKYKTWTRIFESDNSTGSENMRIIGKKKNRLHAKLTNYVLNFHALSLANHTTSLEYISSLVVLKKRL